MDNLSNTLDQARGGDTAAFADIVRQYQSLISGVLFSATGDFHTSEDLAQETFLIAWKKLHELRNDNDLVPWLCTIARNLAHRSFRKARLVAQDTAEEKASSEPGPDAELLRKEQSELVWSAIGEIPESYRETLVLYYRSGQSVKEIASALHASEESIRQRLVRARKSLKSKLETVICDILHETAPGDSFTLGVISAITAGTVLTTSQTVLATTAAAASTAASSTGTVARGTGAAAGKTFSFATLWTIFGPLVVFMMWFSAIFAALDSSVRNAPTLLTRRFQLYTIFRCAQLIGVIYTLWCICIYVTIFVLVHYFPELWKGSLLTHFAIMVPFLGMWCYLLISVQNCSAKKTKRILEYELGVSNEDAASLEKNGCMIRYRKLEDCFFRSIIVNIPILLTFTGLIFMYLRSLGVESSYLWSRSFAWMIIVLVLLAGYYPFGCFLLRRCRTKNDFFDAPPLIENPLEIALHLKEPIPPWKEKHKTKSASFLHAWLIACFCVACGGWIALLNWSENLWGIIAHIAAFLGGCVFLIFLYRKIGNKKNENFFHSAFYFFIVLILLSLLYQDIGTLRWSVIWEKAMNREYGSMESQILILIILACLLGGTVMFIYGVMELRKKPPQEEEIEREKRIKDAVANFDPKNIQLAENESESDLTPHPFPRSWSIWCIVYACVVLLVCMMI